MAYQAKVIPVMIASPGDVAEEREVIREVIHDWNDVNARSAGIVLTAVGWDSHSSPELGARPQELINERLLKECDLLIGVFWTRLGTPTGEAASGTVEEVERHVAAGRPAMIYFSSRPVSPESIDAEQYAQVKAVRAAWQSKGLIESYDNINEFRGKLSKQLPICLATNKHIQTLVGAPIVEVARAVRRTTPQSYALGEEARQLLQAAASGKDGHIFVMPHIGGKFIQAGGKRFGGEYGRESAKWESALGELQRNRLVVARGFKGEVYELTHEGWAAADAL